MCGICGIARSQGTVDAELVGSMAETLRHRGPDDQGVWSSRDARVGLGHRRLSIIDLSAAGHQPMRDASGTPLPSGLYQIQGSLATAPRQVGNVLLVRRL